MSVMRTHRGVVLRRLLVLAAVLVAVGCAGRTNSPAASSPGAPLSIDANLVAPTDGEPRIDVAVTNVCASTVYVFASLDNRFGPIRLPLTYADGTGTAVFFFGMVPIPEGSRIEGGEKNATYRELAPGDTMRFAIDLPSQLRERTANHREPPEDHTDYETVPVDRAQVSVAYLTNDTVEAVLAPLGPDDRALLLTRDPPGIRLHENAPVPLAQLDAETRHDAVIRQLRGADQLAPKCGFTLVQRHASAFLAIPARTLVTRKLYETLSAPAGAASPLVPLKG
jgi:hypothetical protein